MKGVVVCIVVDVDVGAGVVVVVVVGFVCPGARVVTKTKISIFYNLYTRQYFTYAF